MWGGGRMREKVGHFLEWLTAPLEFAGFMALIWGADSRIVFTLLLSGLFSIVIGGIMSYDL